MRLSHYSSDNLPPYINLAQWQAVTHNARHLLIVAGPGTGKTHTLIYRMAYFYEQFKESSRMVAITFTNKAAEQMRERLNDLLGPHSHDMTIGTIHGFCLNLLRRYRQEAGLPLDFQVASSEDCENLARELWPEEKVSQRQRWLSEISEEKSFYFYDKLSFKAQEYNQFLRERHFLDFDDLLIKTVTLLKESPSVLKNIRHDYSYVFVDEYQDLSPVQHDFLLTLIDANMCLTAIGDPHQSIYGFRGSDVKFFKSFPDDFSPASTVELNENYRSASELLLASGQVMAHQSTFPVPSLVAKIMTKGRLIIYEASSDKAEAEYVVHQVEKLVGGATMFSHDSRRVNADDVGERSFGDIAVLYRLNAQNLFLKEAFERSGIPYQVSGEKAFLGQLGLRELICYLRGIVGQKMSPVEAIESVFVKKNEISKEAGSHLFAMAKDFSRLEDFLDYLALQRPEDMFVQRAEKISLMTLHAAKGLEFPVVFIVGCEENIIPLNWGRLVSNPEEERRLFYVGMTRAKETLYLTRVHRRRLFGQSKKNAPSRFLSDIQEELKEYKKNEARRSRPKQKPESKQFDLFAE